MYSDFHVSEEWVCTDKMSVRIIYKLYADPTYLSVHKLIDPEKYIFFYTMEGKGTIVVDSVPVAVEDNTLVIIQAKNDLRYWCNSDIWNFWLFEFKTDRMIFEPRKVYSLLLTQQDLTHCTMALEELKQGNNLLASVLFQTVYYTAYKKLQSADSEKDKRIVRAAISYMRANIKNFALEDLCLCQTIQERTLRNVFQRVLKTPPKQYFQYLRLEASKQYLESSVLSIAQIAGELGFSGSGHFSMAFKKEYGMTPSQYRSTFNLPKE